jgi:hypothetical protein
MHVQSSQSDWITRAQAVLPAGGFGNFDPSIIIREGRARGCGMRMARSMSTT